MKIKLALMQNLVWAGMFSFGGVLALQLVLTVLGAAIAAVVGPEAAYGSADADIVSVGAWQAICLEGIGLILLGILAKQLDMVEG